MALFPCAPFRGCLFNEYLPINTAEQHRLVLRKPVATLLLDSSLTFSQSLHVNSLKRWL